MLQRLGNVIYWAASGAAVLFLLAGVLMVMDTPDPHLSSSDWDSIFVDSVIAGLIWLAGKATRYVLAG
jgi:hypothetical protein